MLKQLTSRPKRKVSKSKLRPKRREKITPSPLMGNLDDETEPEAQQLQDPQQTLDLKQCFAIDYAVHFNHKTTLNCQHSRIAPGFCDDRLVPLTVWGKRGGYSRGTWISSSPSAALLFLFRYTPDSPLVLLISLNGKIQEEHLISELHLSWPQMSCATVRGSRVVFASYKDSVGQIQKFAMRFLNSSQSQLFIDSLKDSMKDVGNIGLPSSNSFSEIPRENESIHSVEVQYSAAAGPDPAYSASNDNPIMQTSGCFGAEGSPFGETSTPGEKSTDRSLPSSNSGFLTNSYTEVHKGATETVKVPMEADLFSHLAKNLPGSSFNAMLGQLEKFIRNLEGDMTLEV